MNHRYRPLDEPTQNLLAPLLTPFSSEQIAIIEGIVDAKLASIGLLTQTTADLKPYHTIVEIRKLIIEQLPNLIEWFGSNEFDIAVLRHFLARKITMREGDLELLTKNMTRWDQQVLNALDPTGWQECECPIVSTGKRRQYRINLIAVASVEPV